MGSCKVCKVCVCVSSCCHNCTWRCRWLACVLCLRHVLSCSQIRRLNSCESCSCSGMVRTTFSVIECLPPSTKQDFWAGPVCLTLTRVTLVSLAWNAPGGSGVRLHTSLSVFVSCRSYETYWCLELVSVFLYFLTTLFLGLSEFIFSFCYLSNLYLPLFFCILF